jgi:hypothetical protein
MQNAVCSVLLLLVVLIAGCPRTYPEGVDPQAQVRGSHPWDSPAFDGKELARTQDSADDQRMEASGGGVIDARPERGPAFPEQDTLDESKLVGSWLVVAATADEKQYILPTSDQDTFELQPRGYLVYHAVADWKDTTSDGHWKKVKPGVLGISIGSGGQITEFSSQLYEDGFLYMWSYDQRSGLWMARLPEKYTDRLEANRFDTTRGTLVLSDVVGTSFSGKVAGTRSMTVSGFYNRGIISMRWDQDDRTGSGFAMFIVSPDWKSLKGAWWIDDYEAAPFSGPWDGKTL